MPLSFSPEQLNAARGHLKTVLHKGLWQCMDVLLRARCFCKDATFFQYNLHLMLTGAWPLEQTWNSIPVGEILHRLDSFLYEPDVRDCRTCTGKSFTDLVDRATEGTRNHFDGLCLDCLNVSADRNTEKYYWEQDRKYQWSKNCRVTHQESSWYYSFCGREDSRRKYQKEKQRRIHGLRY